MHLEPDETHAHTCLFLLRCDTPWEAMAAVFAQDRLYQQLMATEAAYYAAVPGVERRNLFVRFLTDLTTFVMRGKHQPNMSEIAADLASRDQGDMRCTRLFAAPFPLPDNGSLCIANRDRRDLSMQVWAALGSRAVVLADARRHGYDLTQPDDVARNHKALDQAGFVTMAKDTAQTRAQLKQAAPSGTTIEFVD